MNGELERIISQACTDAMFAVLPPGEYPLDVAIIAEARAAIARLIGEVIGEDEVAAASPEYRGPAARNALRAEQRRRLEGR